MLPRFRQGCRRRRSLLRIRHRRSSKRRQSIFEKVKRLRAHGERMNLACRGKPAHRLPRPGPRGYGRKKNLNLFAGSGIDRLQVHRDQQRQRGNLARAHSGGERVLVTQVHHFPVRRFAVVSVNRADPQALPQLGESPQHRRFCKLAAQPFARLFRRHRSFFVQQLPQLHDQRGHAVPGGFLRRALPVPFRAQRKHKR
jgi:hypothetical protein